MKSESITQQKHKLKFFVIFLFIALFILGVTFSYFGLYTKKSSTPKIITISTLEKVIDISEFSTFQAVYNGIAEVRNEEDPEKIDYYVSYRAKVNAGFLFHRVEFIENKETKVITIKIPGISITDVDVDIASLDYIFENKKSNTSMISMVAYQACIEDATNESKSKPEIKKLAMQNAENIMKALVSPFLDQMEDKYALEVEFGGDYE